MTFYNVISGILFLGACQNFLSKLGSVEVWYAAALLLVIVNEAMSTSELVERKSAKVDYNLVLKLIDLITFGVLLWALLVLNPQSSALDVDVSQTLLGANQPAVFWLLLTSYWFPLTDGWNRLAGQYSRNLWNRWYITFMKWRWIPFLILAIFSYLERLEFSTHSWPGVTSSICLTCFIFMKLVARRAGRPTKAEEGTENLCGGPAIATSPPAPTDGIDSDMAKSKMSASLAHTETKAAFQKSKRRKRR